MSARGAEQGPASAAEAWLPVSDALLAGVHHALNNRLATVGALAQLLALGDRSGTEAVLPRELERLGATLRLIGLLHGHAGETQVPLRIPDFLPDALALAAQHRDIREVELSLETDPGALPVLATESALLRAVLALLVSAGLAARESGARHVAVRLGGDERFVSLEAEPAGDAVGGPLGGAGLGALWEAAGGEVEMTETGVIARLPTLPEARRREREER